MAKRVLQRFLVAALIFGAVAAVHGAWFVPADASALEAVSEPNDMTASAHLSVWDPYENDWATQVLTPGSQVRGSEGDLIVLTPAVGGESVTSIVSVATSIPFSSIHGSIIEPSVLPNGVPAPSVVGGTPFIGRLRESSTFFPVGSPQAGLPAGEVLNATEWDVKAEDKNGSVGIHTVTLDVGGTPLAFTWDVSRWAKGDVFAGMHQSTFKVFSRLQQFKRFVAVSDYQRAVPGPDPNGLELEGYTTGCTVNWLSGEMFATNFSAFDPAVNVITRHPGSGPNVPVPYSDSSRRVSTRIMRSGEAPVQNTPLDFHPESVVFDGSQNMYVGHSFGYARLPYLAALPTPGEFFNDDRESFWDINLQPVEIGGLIVDPLAPTIDYEVGVVDENGDPILDPVLDEFGFPIPGEFVQRLVTLQVAPPISAIGFGELNFYYNNSVRLGSEDTPGLVDPDDQSGTYSFQDVVTAENGTLRLPKAFWEDPVTGAWLHNVEPPNGLIPYKWSLGRRLHRYNAYEETPGGPKRWKSAQDQGDGSPFQLPDVFWTFASKQGTDIIDLSADQTTVFYTSESSYVHRYNTAPVLPDYPRGHQLGDAGGGRIWIDGFPSGPTVNLRGVRLLPPGDGSGGMLVAAGGWIYRLDSAGRAIQQYRVMFDQDVADNTRPDGIVSAWYSLEIDPDGRTFWAASSDTGKLYHFNISTGNLVGSPLQVVQWANGSETEPSRRVESLCIMMEYTAAQEICNNSIDDDLDGFIDEHCQALEVCNNGLDEDNDGLIDDDDPDCGPTAVNDQYAVDLGDVLTVSPSGILINDRTQPGLSVSGGGGTALALVSPGTSFTTAHGATVVLGVDGAFTYTQAPGSTFVGSDQFFYRANNGESDSNIATVSIEISTPTLVGAPDQYTTAETQVLTIPASGILANDSGTGALSVVWISRNGTRPEPDPGSISPGGSVRILTNFNNWVTVFSDGSMVYEPALYFFGPDHFVYWLTDANGSRSEIITVNILVTPISRTAVASTSNPSVYGTAATLTATVTCGGLNPATDGTISFVVDGNTVATGVAVVNGIATFPLSAALPVDAYDISAVYSVAPEVCPGSDGSNTHTVNPKPLTATITAANKPYNGNAVAVVTSCNVVGAVLGETITCTATTGFFDTANVGTGKTVTPTNFATQGVTSNYTGPAPPTTTANITPLVLTATITANNKPYDGNTAAVVTSCTVTGEIGTDNFTCTATTGAFDTANVGTGKLVTPTNYVMGTFSTNYTGPADPTTTANITPLALTATITAANKPYDGNTAAVVTSCDVTGEVAGDSFTCTATTGTFDTANVGTGKLVTPTNYVMGTFTGNYTGPTQPTTTANITTVPLTATITANNKPYDGNTAAVVTSCDVTGEVAGDSFTCTATTGTFDTANVGTGKTVTPTNYVMGTFSTNYTGPADPTTTANITLLALTATITANNKPYDGNTAAVVTSCTVTGEIGTDNFTCTATTGTFDTANVGTGKLVTPTNYVMGTFSTNYTGPADPTTTANITPKALTATITANNKPYDGNTAAVVTSCDVTGEVAGDSFTCTATTGTFDTANAGTGKTVTPTNFATQGITSNYSGPASPTTTANITPLALTATITANNKPYDGNTAAVVTSCDVTGEVAGDSFTCTATTGTFDTANVGTGKTVTPTNFATQGVTLNYTAPIQPTTTANITLLALTATITANNKPYDGNTAAVVTSCTVTGEIGTDNFTCTATTGAFDTANVGTGKLVTPTNYVMGTFSTNYTGPADPTTTANITPKALTATITANNKPYDGNTAAVVTSCDVTGEVAGDSFTCTATTGTFDTANAGTGKTVTPTNFATQGITSNYSGPASPTTTANITPLALTATITANNKPYDGNTAAVVTSCDVTGEVAGDSFTCTATTGTFDTANVGTGKTVTPTNFATQGVTSNYTAPIQPTTTANITLLALTATITANNKPYDGNTAAVVTSCTVTGEIGTDNFTCTATTGAFDTANVGTGKLVTPTNYVMGTFSTNYTGPADPTTTANITPKALTATITANNKPYDGNTAAVVTSCDVTGEVAGDSFTCTATTGTFDTANAGTGKTVTPTNFAPVGVTSNYSGPATPTTTANITQATVTLVIPPVTEVYDGTTQPTTCTVTSGGGATLSATITYTGTGATVYGPSATAPTAAGTYASDCTFSGDNNHAGPVTELSTVTVLKRPLTVTANNRTKAYGQSVTLAGTEFSLTAGTLVAGNTLTSVTLTSAGDPPAASVSGSPYAIVPSAAVGTGLVNYDITYVNGALTITKVTLTVRADDKSKTTGAVNPPLTATITGFANGETASVLSGAPDLSTTAITESPAGTYPITAALGTLASENYQFTFVNGTLTVTGGDACTIGGFTTYSQGGWGAKPSGNNPGQLLQANFAAVYPGGFVQIGGVKKLKFTSASAIEKFLPQGGTPKALAASAPATAVNPTSSTAGNFAAQVLALQLAMDFSSAGVLKSGLGDLVMVSGPFAGSTVSQVLALANLVLGGQTSALPSGMSVSTLNTIVESLNLNFHEGTVNSGLLRCPAAPEASQASEAETETMPPTVPRHRPLSNRP